MSASQSCYEMDHREEGLSDRYVSLHCPGGGWKYEMKVLARLFLPRPLSMAHRWTSPSCVLRASHYLCLCPVLFSVTAEDLRLP